MEYDPSEDPFQRQPVSEAPMAPYVGSLSKEETLKNKIVRLESELEMRNQQMKYMKDHLASARSLIQDKEQIIENLMMRYDLGILPTSSEAGDHSPDCCSDCSNDHSLSMTLRSKADSLAQRTILENFELREMVNELRDENFHLRGDLYELQDRVNRQHLQLSKVEDTAEDSIRIARTLLEYMNEQKKREKKELISMSDRIVTAMEEDYYCSSSRSDINIDQMSERLERVTEMLEEWRKLDEDGVKSMDEVGIEDGGDIDDGNRSSEWGMPFRESDEDAADLLGAEEDAEYVSYDIAGVPGYDDYYHSDKNGNGYEYGDESIQGGGAAETSFG